RRRRTRQRIGSALLTVLAAVLAATLVFFSVRDRPREERAAHTQSADPTRVPQTVAPQPPSTVPPTTIMTTSTTAPPVHTTTRHTTSTSPPPPPPSGPLAGLPILGH